ncbi:YcxB family protein [Henriciella sp.]|uniref:YcxB family protein n=1 Tax=Henriciella sp. TaxID=1968823 RepID=UPI00260C3494|nr:YcxB family protein [Henriciella sp.]
MEQSPSALHISGQLRDKDMKRLVNETRSSNIGPTSLYYAGVTAPAISASMALVSRHMLDQAPFSAYWIWLISTMMAAMAGIVWYLIFVRWAYRHQAGRAGEIDTETKIDLTPQGLHIQRGAVETRITWPGVKDVRLRRGYTLITFYGADPVIVPNKWFTGNKATAKAFRSRLMEGLSHGTQQEETRPGRA